MGKAAAPPITLNTMYHCVPKMIRKLSQMLVLRLKARIRLTVAPNSRLTGKAARNWAIGWTVSAKRGLRPIHTLIGTQTRLASTMSTKTRTSV